MIPQQVLSTATIPAAFLPPRNEPKQPLEDYELGGVALNDSSQGLRVYTWRGRYIDGEIVLDVPGIVAPVSVLAVADVTEFQFTFDQNMQPFIAFVVGDTDAKYRWFDGTLPGFVTDDLPAGTITPRCSLDDKRDSQGAASDIILTYMRDGSLYFRAQRDRYANEYLLEENLDGYELGQVGMSRALRFQWQLVPIPPEDA